MNAPGPRTCRRHAARRVVGFLAVAGVTVLLLGGCFERTIPEFAEDGSRDGYGTTRERLLPAGTRIPVALAGDVSSATARVGDSWSGTVAGYVASSDGASIPPGSEVDGVVVGVAPARDGGRAMLELGVRGIRVDGRILVLGAISEPVLASVARDLAAGPATGDVVLGGMLGNPAGDAPAARPRQVAGNEVVMSDGSVMNFTVSRTVSMR